MTSPALARTANEFEGGWRYYPWPLPPAAEKVRLPSVTTIAGLAPGGNLQDWAVRQALAAIAGGASADDAKTAHKVALQAAADVGTMAHGAIEAWAAGDDYDREMEGFVIAAHAALTEMAIAPEIVEVTMYAPDFGYAGTADLIGSYPDGQLAMVDWKTGSVQWPTRGLQMAALSMAQYAALEDGVGGWVLEPALQISRAVAISVKGDGSWDWRCWEHDEIIEEFDAFLTLRKLWDWHRPRWSL